MRTYFNVVITNRNVLGFGLDRVVSSLNASCAHAAQHSASRHASKRASERSQAFKRCEMRRWTDAGTALLTKLTSLAMPGPKGLRGRLMSPSLVTG